MGKLVLLCVAVCVTCGPVWSSVLGTVAPQCAFTFHVPQAQVGLCQGQGNDAALRELRAQLEEQNNHIIELQQQMISLQRHLLSPQPAGAEVSTQDRTGNSLTGFNMFLKCLNVYFHAVNISKLAAICTAQNTWNNMSVSLQLYTYHTSESMVKVQ